MGQRSQVLGDRIEQGADALAAFARTLSDADWRVAVPRDGRTIGVVVHHVANMYPIEIELAQTLASGKPIAGVTWAAVDKINADHSKQYAAVTKTEALDLLQRNSRSAAAAVRALSDAALDQAAPVSLNADAPLTCQFFVEDHALRHSFHHLAKIKAALGR